MMYMTLWTQLRGRCTLSILHRPDALYQSYPMRFTNPTRCALPTRCGLPILPDACFTDATRCTLTTRCGLPILPDVVYRSYLSHLPAATRGIFRSRLGRGLPVRLPPARARASRRRRRFASVYGAIHSRIHASRRRSVGAEAARPERSRVPRHPLSPLGLWTHCRGLTCGVPKRA
jgi:hypothetical protein